MSLPLADPSQETADGFVLAGGFSSRMGRDKALLELNGIPLVQLALDILNTAGLRPRVAGARSDLSSFAPIVADDPQHSGRGPLSGIVPALIASSAPLAVFQPVDLPLIPAELISVLLHHAIARGSVVTLASTAGFIQTFPVVIHRDAAGILEKILHSENRNCLAAFRAASKELARPVSVLPIELLVRAGQIRHPHGLPAHLWFQNVNSPADHSRAEALLARQYQVI